MMLDEGPRYNHSAEAAAHIMNVVLSKDDPPAIRFSKILYTILQAMYEADCENRQALLTPSEN